MALARVVSFEGVSAERMAELKREIEADERPQEIPASQILLLHEPESGEALAVLLFDTDEDYRKGDEALNAMPTGDTPGRRLAVTKYEVAVNRTA